MLKHGSVPNLRLLCLFYSTKENLYILRTDYTEYSTTFSFRIWGSKQTKEVLWTIGTYYFSLYLNQLAVYRLPDQWVPLPWQVQSPGQDALSLSSAVFLSVSWLLLLFLSLSYQLPHELLQHVGRMCPLQPEIRDNHD